MTRCPPRVQCRGVVPAVSHVMLHSDQLANEFNEILNAVEIFAPFQPLDPAVVFYAPLRHSVRDLRLSQDEFQRSSVAFYKDGVGIYRSAGINQPRFEGGRLVMEPARTNKCENYNANPDPGLAGINPDGGTLTRESDPDQLRGAGLQDICADGRVVRIENQTGSNIFPTIAGNVGNLDPHCASCWVNGYGATFEFGISSAGQRADFTTSELEHICLQVTPGNTGNTLQFLVAPGEKIDFVLNQLEESEVTTSPIVTQGTAGQRAVDALEYADPIAWFNQPAGMVLMDWAPSFDSGKMFAGNFTESMLSLIESRFNLLFLRAQANTVPTMRSQMANSRTAVGPDLDFNAGDSIRFAVRWNQAAVQFQIGQSVNGSWEWGTEVTATLSDFDISDKFYINWLPNNWPSRSGQVYVYNEDRGRAWIEANH